MIRHFSCTALIGFVLLAVAGCKDNRVSYTPTGTYPLPNVSGAGMGPAPRGGAAASEKETPRDQKDASKDQKEPPKDEKEKGTKP